MKYLLKSLLTVATFVLLLQSCVNKDYDFDNIDTTAVFRIPPIMLGSIEIELADLDELPIEILPPNLGFDIPALSVVKSYTLYDLFGEEVVDNFFFDGAGTVEIAASATVRLPLSGATIDFFFNILDSEGEPLSSVNIPRQRLTVGENPNFRITLDERYMRFMNNAQSLEMVMLIASPAGATLIDGNSYLKLNNVIIRTGGIRFDLFD